MASTPFQKFLDSLSTKQIEEFGHEFVEKSELGAVIRHRFVIDGDPIPLARPRFAKNHVYDSQSNEKFGTSLEIQAQHVSKEQFNGPLHIDFLFYMKIPKVSMKRSNSMKGKPHISRPDVDNLVKFYCDCMIDVLFKDDCIISSLSAKKIYDMKPRTEFTIVPFK